MSECKVGKEVDFRVIDGDGDYDVQTLHEVLDENDNVIGYGVSAAYARMMATSFNEKMRAWINQNW